MVKLSVSDSSFSFGRHVPQVLLLVLTDYSPLQTALTLFYRSVECKGSKKPCGTCDVCVNEHFKPTAEIIYFGSEQGLAKEAVLKIKETAESSGSSAGSPRIFVITGIEHMSPQAANSLLKFLEQTAPGVFFVLTTRDLSAVLPTVVSRATTLWLQPDPAAFKSELTAFVKGEDLDVLLNACSDVTQARTLLADPLYGAVFEACTSMGKYQTGKIGRMALINALKGLGYPHLAMCRRYLANKFSVQPEKVAFMTNLDRRPLKVIVADEIADGLEENRYGR